MKTRIAVALMASWCGLVSVSQAADVSIHTTATMVEEGCVLNDSAAKIVDFGKIAPRDLVKPGTKAQEVSLPINCKDIGKTKRLNLHVSGLTSRSNPTLFATSMNDIGLALSSENDFTDSTHWLLPGRGQLPVRLHMGKAMVSFFASPIHTGKTVTAGTFSAQVVLTVEYL